MVKVGPVHMYRILFVTDTLLLLQSLNLLLKTQQLIMNAEPFEPSAVVNTNEVRFGAKCILVGVDIKEEKHIQIVSSMEADISKGLIAIDAPIAKVLLVKNLNDKVEIMSRGVKQAFKISKIQY